MITGYHVTPCPHCGAGQPFLHLHEAAPSLVRCGMCGATGPRADTTDKAVDAWNREYQDIRNAVSASGRRAG